MTLAQVTYPPAPTHPKTHPAKRAVTLLANRVWQERDDAIERMTDQVDFDGAAINAMTQFADQVDVLKFNIFNCTLNYAEAEATRLWADFCQTHQLCLECGGELVREYIGSVRFIGGTVDDGVREELTCRECGAVSNWKQPVCETGEELPI